MKEVYMWLGAIGILLIGIGVVLTAGHLLFESCERYYLILLRKLEDRAVREMGDRIYCDSYLFSEDTPTMKLLSELGRRLSQRGYYDVRSLRDEWQKERETR